MILDDIIDVLKLDQKQMKKLGRRKEATRNAYLVTLFGGLLGAIIDLGLMSFSGELSAQLTGLTTAPLPLVIITAIVVNMVVAVLGVWLFTGLYWLASKIFGAKRPIIELFRVVGHGAIIAGLYNLPWIGAIFFIYSAFIDTTAIKSVQDLGWGQSIGAFVISMMWIVLIILTLVLIAGAAVFLGGGLGLPSSTL